MKMPRPNIAAATFGNKLPAWFMTMRTAPVVRTIWPLFLNVRNLAGTGYSGWSLTVGKTPIAATRANALKRWNKGYVGGACCLDLSRREAKAIPRTFKASSYVLRVTFWEPSAVSAKRRGISHLFFHLVWGVLNSEPSMAANCAICLEDFLLEENKFAIFPCGMCTIL